jgi:hypothetical protein
MPPERVCAREGCNTPLRPPKRADAKWCSDACATAVRRGARTVTAPTRKPSGKQLSYPKATRALAEYFVDQGMLPEFAWPRAEMILRPVLPERQRGAA